ncbi:dihydroneopterin aldolase family protein [Methanocaldococcus indicus]|uniref:dihydroneopterin aldolase family protein n=1 Tax=Methanocaldococcus indicus TaxID=213231 RepID=UPI003C6D6C9A
MRVENSDIFNQYFKNLNDRERAIFEGGISLGALFHQFVGTPVSIYNKESLERAMEESIKNQPFVDSIKVNIKNVDEKYKSLTGDMLDVKLSIKINNIKAHFRLKYIDEIDYPLMYIEKIEEG